MLKNHIVVQFSDKRKIFSPLVERVRDNDDDERVSIYRYSSYLLIHCDALGIRKSDKRILTLALACKRQRDSAYRLGRASAS